MEKLAQLISELEARLVPVSGRMEQYEEATAEEGYVDVYDWSGGNFDDAYDIGLRHGEMFAEHSLLTEIISKLSEVSE